MKIAVNTRILLKGRMEGVSRYIHETTRRMVINHPEDEFIFLFDRPFHPSFIYADNITPVVISPPTRDPILWKIWFDYSVPRALTKHKAEVFYSGDSYASLRTKVPTVIVSHDIAYHHYPEHIPKRVLQYYEKNFPLFHQNAAHIVAVSQFTKNDIVNAYNLDPDKVSVAGNAVPDGFQPISEVDKQNIRNLYTNGSPFIIYLGSIHPRKNVAALVKAFELFKRQNKEYKLIILGRKAWKYEDFETTIRISAFQKDIIFLDGHKYNPQSILPAAHALCYISLFEGFGIPLLEAMASDVPVITSNVSSMPEVAGNAAVLVNPLNIQEIAKAIKMIISDEKLRAELITNGRKRLKEFNWDKSAKIIYKTLKKVTKQ